MTDFPCCEQMTHHQTEDGFEPFEAVLRFEHRRPPISLNDRLHHMVKAKLTAAMRLEAAEAAHRIPQLGKCEVTLTWYVTTKARRDDENPVPSLKAWCDGLIDAGVVEDDTATFMVKNMPRIQWIDKKTDVAHMELRIEKIR
jgi:crossover junction endodeoxyribonuclease RusA